MNIGQVGFYSIDAGTVSIPSKHQGGIMILSKMASLNAQHLEERALHVALLAFRCARQDQEKQDNACAIALKAYLAIAPNDADAADKVIEGIADAVKHRPHWLTPEMA